MNFDIAQDLSTLEETSKKRRVRPGARKPAAKSNNRPSQPEAKPPDSQHDAPKPATHDPQPQQVPLDAATDIASQNIPQSPEHHVATLANAQPLHTASEAPAVRDALPSARDTEGLQVGSAVSKPQRHSDAAEAFKPHPQAPMDTADVLAAATVEQPAARRRVMPRKSVKQPPRAAAQNPKHTSSDLQADPEVCRVQPVQSSTLGAATQGVLAAPRVGSTSSAVPEALPRPNHPQPLMPACVARQDVTTAAASAPHPSECLPDSTSTMEQVLVPLPEPDDNSADEQPEMRMRSQRMKKGASSACKHTPSSKSLQRKRTATTRRASKRVAAKHASAPGSATETTEGEGEATPGKPLNGEASPRAGAYTVGMELDLIPLDKPRKRARRQAAAKGTSTRKKRPAVAKRKAPVHAESDEESGEEMHQDDFDFMLKAQENVFDQMTKELQPRRGRKRSKVDTSKPIDSKMTLEEVILHANARTRQLDHEQGEIQRTKKKREAAAATAAAAAAAEEGHGKIPVAHVEEAVAAEPSQDPREAAAPSHAPKLVLRDGQIVVDEESLRVRAGPSTQVVLEHVGEDTRPVNAFSYLPMSKLAKERWTEAETEKFYDALKSFGTDFFLMSNWFHGRTRKQVKNKYLKESKVNPRRIREALTGTKTDLDPLRQMRTWVEQSEANAASASAPGTGGQQDGGTLAAQVGEKGSAPAKPIAEVPGDDCDINEGDLVDGSMAAYFY